MAYLLYMDRQFFDNNGDPLALGKIYTYITGTSTPKATYTDSTGGSTHPNPVVLDSNGRADIWLNSDAAYRFIIKDASDNVIGSTLDNVSGVGLSLSAFDQLSADLDLNGYGVTGTGSISITGNITCTGTYSFNSLNVSGATTLTTLSATTISGTALSVTTITGTATSITSLTASSTATISGLVTANANLYVKNGSTGSGTIRIYEDSDNGSNYGSITVNSSLSNDNGVLTLPTVATLLPTSTPSSTSKPIEMSTSGQLNPTTYQAAGYYLGSITASPSGTTMVSSTSILTGFSRYRLLMATDDFNGLLGGTADKTFRFQPYCNGSYYTGTNANTFLIGTKNIAGTYTAINEYYGTSCTLFYPNAAWSPYLRGLDMMISTKESGGNVYISITGTLDGVNEAVSFTGFVYTTASLTGFRLELDGGTASGQGEIHVYGYN